MTSHTVANNLRSISQRRFSSTIRNGCGVSVHSLRTSMPRRHILFGSNTDVGKTIVSAGLVRTTTISGSHYIKPLQCGGSDQEFVERYSSTKNAHTLFRWETPASPHEACRIENAPISDKQVMEAIASTLERFQGDGKTTWIETAGGVLSPSSASPQNISPQHAICTKSGWGWKTQADLYRSLIGTCSTILVGDGRLGGISATLSSLESLLMRGYHVAGLILIETPPYDNLTALRNFISCTKSLQCRSDQTLFNDIERSVVALPPLPPPFKNLHEWYASEIVHEKFVAFNQHLEDSWKVQFPD